MSNSAPKCGLCFAIQNEKDSDKKKALENLLNSKEVSSPETVLQLQQKYGIRSADSSIRRHRLEKNDERPANATPKPNVTEKSPPGWDPYAEYTESIGSAIVRLPRPESTHRDLLITAGFNPDEWQIAGPVNTRRWMRYDQEWLYYYKFDVIAGESPEVVQEHVNELVKVIRKPKKATKPVASKTDAFVFAASDWQIGKKEGSDGTPETIQRVLMSIDMAVQRIKDLRKVGHAMPTLLIAGLGDLGEGTCGFYPGQQFLIDRNRREQGRINRELITKAIERLSPLFDKTIIAAVGGNHGENRSPDGDRLTSDGDNDDCAYFDAVKEAYDLAGHDELEWHIMEDELSMSLTVGGVPIGLTHGHLFQRGKGSTAQQKAHEWWKGQDFGFQALRGTRILLSAHFHHFSAVTHGSRTHLQTPAMDPGSKWVREMNGEATPPGTLTFRLDGDSLLGWEDLSILRPVI